MHKICFHHRRFEKHFKYTETDSMQALHPHHGLTMNFYLESIRLEVHCRSGVAIPR
jgi:hypothetical protein